MDGWMDVCMDEWMDRCMGGWMDGWTGQWMGFVEAEYHIGVLESAGVRSLVNVKCKTLIHQ